MSLICHASTKRLIIFLHAQNVFLTKDKEAHVHSYHLLVIYVSVNMTI